jgi:hypothetical protein
MLLQRIPVDLSGCLAICSELPTPRVRDRESGEVRKDRDGRTQFSVGVCVIQERDSDVVSVTVAGEPAGLVRGAPVIVRGLVAIPWEQRDDRSGQLRHGVAFRAESIVPADGSGAPAPGGGSGGAGAGGRPVATARAAG